MTCLTHLEPTVLSRFFRRRSVIRRLADVPGRRACKSHCMQLLIEVRADDPPQGLVTRMGEEGKEDDAAHSLEFVGWLGMLRALNELLTVRPRG